MIIGTGVDIVEIERMATLIKRQESAIKRFLTTDEQQLLHGKSETRQAEMVAGRFAAKEAGAKALGTGIGAVLSFLDMEILPNHSGKPVMTIKNEVYSKLDLDPARIHIHVSISHSQTHAIAQVIIEER
ncbi:holo-[acyl-carrier-protein] synthase [Brevibacillus sp. AG162]|uniref:holo-ACP synthase n=1 Tax=Brevibacillus sp. AG162 TaxID=2572910 RepID=UPI0011504132|nr:holo-ACP synthase [Brevibacillus sp. AG162]TQK49593.1 holo-[acyl-carrier-protein] synthase [Brevibacillus sp. AG162]